MSESENISDIVIYSVVIPIAIIIGLKMAVEQVVNYLKTLWVNGKPNEWILIMNSGKMVKAGVGLRCFKGPFD